MTWSVQSTLATEVLLAPSTGSYNIGQTFTIVVKVSPDTTSVTAVDILLKFDPELFSVVSLSKSRSVLSLWTTEPTFSNSIGRIAFAGKSSSPLTSDSNLLNITFKAISTGSGNVNVLTAPILDADKNDTDIYLVGNDGTYSIVSAISAITEVPSTPLVSSPSFSDSEVWYQKTRGIFTWTLPLGVDAVAVEIATSSNNEPDEHENSIYEPPVTKFNITRDIIQDGTSYLSIKYKNQIGWGTVLNKKIQIDTIPPEEFSVHVTDLNQKTGFPTLNFSAVDIISGIDYYDVIVANKDPVKITVNEAMLGYTLSELEDGTYAVMVVAHDKAGNTRESIISVPIVAGWVKPNVPEPRMSVSDFLSVFNMMFTLLLLVIVLQFIYMRYSWKQGRSREEKLFHETIEIQSQMEKIFTALRDEIYDQINIISKRKRPNKKEREAIDELNQALEVSETLIGKEINDVKSILK